MPLITILLEGGFVTAIYADDPDTAIVVMDMDIEGCDPDDPGLYADTAFLRRPEVRPYHAMPKEEAVVFQCCDMEAVIRLLPSWMQEIPHCDGLEVHPFREDKEEKTGDSYAEVCEPGEAHFWSVCGHLKEGGMTCLQDFATEVEAIAFAKRLLRSYTQLQVYGLS